MAVGQQEDHHQCAQDAHVDFRTILGKIPRAKQKNRNSFQTLPPPCPSHNHSIQLDFRGECVRLANFVVNAVIENNTISDCGIYDYEFDEGSKNGEGIYIGTAYDQVKSCHRTRWHRETEIGIPCQHRLNQESTAKVCRTCLFLAFFQLFLPLQPTCSRSTRHLRCGPPTTIRGPFAGVIMLASQRTAAKP